MIANLDVITTRTNRCKQLIMVKSTYMRVSMHTV